MVVAVVVGDVDMEEDPDRVIGEEGEGDKEEGDDDEEDMYDCTAEDFGVVESDNEAKVGTISDEGEEEE